MNELATIIQMIFGTTTSFFYHRPLREQLLKLIVVFSGIWMTSCSDAVWKFDSHQSTVNEVDTGTVILQDKIAVVGKVFLYRIPNQIEERNLSLQVTEAGSGSLPGWLKFNNDDSTLYGIATVLDIGYHYISVTITSSNNRLSNSYFNDVFTIDVVLDALPKQSNSEQIDFYDIEESFKLTYQPRLGHCMPDQPRFAATVIIGTSFQQLNGQQRVDTALRFAEFVFRSPIDITLSPRKSTSITRLLKKSIVAAGVGNVDDKPRDENVEISWTIACNYQFRAEDFTRIIQHNIVSGTLTDIIGYSVLGWYITRDEPKIKPSRFRRQVNGIGNGTPVPTPSLTMVPPTHVRSSISFYFPSTSIYFESSIELTPSTLIQTVGLTSSLDLTTLSTIMTSSPGILPSSSDAVSDIVMTSELYPSYSTSTTFLMMSTSSGPISSFVPELTSSTIKDIEPSTSYISINSSVLSSRVAEDSSTAFSELPSVESSLNVYASTSLSLTPSTIVPFSTTSLPISLMGSTGVPSSSLAITSVTETSQVSSQALTPSESESFSTSISSPTIVSSFVTTSFPEISVDVSSEMHIPQTTSVEMQSYTFFISPSFSLPMTTSSVDYFATSSVDYFATSSTDDYFSTSSFDYFATSSVDYFATSSTDDYFSTSSVDYFATSSVDYFATSSTDDYFSTSSFDYFATSSVDYFATSSTDDYFSTSSVDYFATSSTDDYFSTSSVDYFATSSIDEYFATSSVDYFATTSLFEESSILMPSEFSSPALVSSFNDPLTSLTSSSIFIESTDIFMTSLLSSILPIMTSVTPSSLQMSTSSFELEISPSELLTPVSSLTSLSSSTLSQALLSSTMLPSLSTSSPQIQMSSSLGSPVSTSLYISSSLMPSSRFILPSPSSFPSSSIIETTVPSMVPTPTLSTSFMASFTSIPATSIQHMMSSKIMPTPSISSASVMLSSTLLDITPEPVDEMPIVLNAINHIKIMIGRILRFSIPADTFHDPEDGNTRNLQLELLTADNKPLEGTSWVRIDAERQVIYGLAVDTALINQKVVYNLFAIDSKGYSVFDALYVEVLPDPVTYSHRYLITFSNGFYEFTSDINNAINVCRRLADYYGDPNTNAITVASVTEGSVVYGYSNNSISENVCDADAVNREYSWLAYANGSVNVGLTIVMQPKYTVIAVKKEFQGVCLTKPQTTESPNAIAVKQTSKKVIDVVIPAIICALLLLMIGVCVCCCYKRKRHGEEFLLREERNMFVRNRKPIFLDNELEPRSAKAAEPIVMPKDISPFLASPISVNMPLESRPSPPSYLNEAYEKDDPDGGIPMSPLFLPPAYFPQPMFNRLPPSYLDPPAYRLPPAYESEDVGMFETSKI